MNKRRLTATVLFGTVFVFILNPVAHSLAEPGVPGDAPSAPVTPETTTPTVPAPDPAPAATPAPAAATPSASPTTSTDPTDTSTDRPTTYTVVEGDSLWLIGHKYHCTVTALKKLNGLKNNNLKPGQVLKLPPPKTSSKTTAPTATPAPDVKPNASVSKPQKTYAKTTDAPSEKSDHVATKAPQAQLVSPAELDADLAAASRDNVAPAVALAPKPTTKHLAKTLGEDADATAAEAPEQPVPPARPKSGFNLFSIFQPSTSSVDWSGRFLQAARSLAERGIEYDEEWRPPGEHDAWPMDCSNTARYLYKITTGIELPRTASDQYYSLHLQNKAWDVPVTESGFADCNYLRENLKPGDLLFWENTYRPERQPPITHVMIFLGTNDKGEWIMAGSQTSRGGEHNRRNGGPDVYVFNPTQPCGGYTTWLGFVHHQGRFCAYGRPLEADPTKFAVATND